MRDKLAKDFMKIIKIILFRLFGLLLILNFCVLNCAQNKCEQTTDATKREVLNTVTIIKPLQQIILDYLDIPDHVVHRFIGLKLLRGSWGRTAVAEIIKSHDQHRTYVFAISEKDIVFAPQHRFDDQTRLPIQLRNICTGKLTNIIPNALSSIEAVAISPDSKYVAVASANQINEGYLFAVDTGQAIHTFKRQSGCFAFSPDSCYLASSYFNRNNTGHVISTTTEIWDIQTGKPHALFTCQAAGCRLQVPRFSPDSQYLVYATNRYDILMLQLATNRSKQLKCKEPYRLKGPFKYIAFSANGKFLICYFVHSGTKDQLTEIVDIEKETVVASYSGKLVLDPRGKYIIGQKNSSQCAQLASLAPESKIFNLPVMDLTHILNTEKSKLSFASHGTYLIVQSEYGEQNREITIYQNQALDLDCQPGTVTSIAKEQEKTEQPAPCVIS